MKIFHFSISNSSTSSTSFTTTSRSKDNSNHSKHDLKDERIEQMNSEMKALKSFIREELQGMKKMIEDLQRQKATPSHSLITVFKGRAEMS